MPTHTFQEQQRNQSPVVDPTQSNPLAKLLADALGAIGRDVRQTGRVTAEQGLPQALAQGFNNIPAAMASVLGSLPGAQESSRLGIQALAGKSGVEALFGDRQQAPPIDPNLNQSAIPPQGAPQGPVGAPQGIPGLPGGFQSGRIQAFEPQQPLVAPQLPEPRQGVAPDFQAAKDALGGPEQAQQVGRAEGLSRGFGGGAAGGLSAIQGAPTGRAAGAGEVIAGVGAGMAQALAGIHQENRQLESFARVSEELRNKQISSIEMAQEAAKASTSQANIDAYNARGIAQVQLELDVDLANLQAMKPFATADGLADPATGEIVITKQSSVLQNLQALALMSTLEEDASTEVAHVLGTQVLVTNIAPLRKTTNMTAIQALMIPKVKEKIFEHLRASGKNVLVDQAEKLSSGIALTNDAEAQQVSALMIEEVGAMVTQSLNNPTNDPFQGLFSEALQLAMSLGGIAPSRENPNPAPQTSPAAALAP